jgi:hypothetical protein
LFVIIWEPKRGNGGGHQLATDQRKAELIRWQISRDKPDHVIRIETAEDYGAQAVRERGARRRYG